MLVKDVALLGPVFLVVIKIEAYSKTIYNRISLQTNESLNYFTKNTIQ